MSRFNLTQNAQNQSTDQSNANYVFRVGQLRNIRSLKPWDLFQVLVEKYEWSQDDTMSFHDFLTRMLQYDPKKRATAADCLKHPWLQEVMDDELLES